MTCRHSFAILSVALMIGLSPCAIDPAKASPQGQTNHQARTETFKVPALWECSAPLIAPEKRDTNPSRAQKDPTVVYYEGKWHVFMTVKLPGRSAIEYCSFAQWGGR